MKSKLLCTFSNKREYDELLIKICNSYDILFNKIYILENDDDPYHVFMTYNIHTNQNDITIPNTVSVHRKKINNTLYTINALNELIKHENGSYDENYEVNWDNYKNSIILTSNEGLRVIPTAIFKIINI